MSRLGWWLVDAVSHALDEDERDAVRGDFTEVGEPWARALQDVLGLAIRRQAAVWHEWTPWLALLGIVGGAGIPITLFWIWLSTPLLVRLLVFARDGSFYESGLPVTQDIFVAICQCAALSAWLWTAGVALGSASRRAAWITGLLFHILWLSPMIGPMLHLPRLWLPWLVVQLTFTIPSVLGLERGLRVPTVTRRQAGVLAAWTLGATVLSLWTRGWWDNAMEIWSKGAIRYNSVTWQACAMAAACCGPALYLVLMAHRVRPNADTTCLSPRPWA